LTTFVVATKCALSIVASYPYAIVKDLRVSHNADPPQRAGSTILDPGG